MAANNNENLFNTQFEGVQELSDEALEGVSGGNYAQAVYFAAETLKAYGYEVPSNYLDDENLSADVVIQFHQIATEDEKLHYGAILLKGGDSHRSGDQGNNGGRGGHGGRGGDWW